MSYIVVEGLDLSGKSTLCNKLVRHFEAKKVAEPFTETPLSKTVYDIFTTGKADNFATVHLMMIARIELFKTYGHLTRIDSLNHLVSDRSFLTTMTYQSSYPKQMKEILDLNIETIGNYGFDLFPDMIIYMDIPYELLVERAKQREHLDELDKKILDKGYYNEMTSKYEWAIEEVMNRSLRTTIVYVDEYTTDAELMDVIEERLYIRQE